MHLTHRLAPARRRRPHRATLPGTLVFVCLLAALLAGCAGTPQASPPRSSSANQPAGHLPTLTALNPHPFDPNVDAPLPNNRIVAAYGIVGGVQVNGPASTLDLLNAYMPQLQQLGQQYAALDPIHPVKLALDLVINSIQPCSAYPQYCSSWPDDATMQAYVDFCQQHNLLLFLDLQLGVEPVQEAVTKHVLPYLEKYPFVELELDTEFHFPNTPQGYADMAAYPCCEGAMDASEINWALNELAQISLQHQLPRKVLVIDQWYPGVFATYVAPSDAASNKNKIHPIANVSLVLQSDGFGYYSNKIGDYQAFVQQDLLEYGGYKLFYNYPGSTAYDIDYNGVTRVQTPQEVLQLFPQPLFISYQ
jgi:hypothetical protein